MSERDSAPPTEDAAALGRRLTELELGYMALERLVEELSGVVAEQQTVITALQSDLAQLNAKAHGLSMVERTPEDERPPHY